MQFSTQVSGQHEGIHYIRRQPLSQLVSNMSFAAAIYYMITAQQPNPAQEKVFNALLVASIDHGISPASGFVPRVVTSNGNDLVHSMASGLLALGPYHGGAISGCAQMLVQVEKAGLDSLQQSHFASNKRLPGLGHPHYKHSDPRTEQLFAIAKDQKIDDKYQKLMLQIQEYMYKETDKHLVVNIDGAIAALLLDLGFPPQAGNGLFALARAGGMIAHCLEEKTEKPVRRIDEENVDFTPPEGSDE